MKKLLILPICLLTSCSVASERYINIPSNDNQRMIALNYSLTTDSFFKAYMSKDQKQRRLAEMYMIGVIDASEGISWCGYNVASPNAIQEQVYTGLKKFHKESPTERASTAIKSRLEELLPCKDKK